MALFDAKFVKGSVCFVQFIQCRADFWCSRVLHSMPNQDYTLVCSSGNSSSPAGRFLNRLSFLLVLGYVVAEIVGSLKVLSET